MVFKRKESAPSSFAPGAVQTPFDEKIEGMRGRFHQLGYERNTITAKLDQLRAERDKLQASVAGKMLVLEQEIKRIKKPLYDIDRERGSLVRALNGKTGRPEDYTS